VIHPESIVHSLVEYRDGSLIAQLGRPEMRIPISYALGHPARLELDLERLDLAEVARLTFEPPDRDRFPCLALAEQALAQGGLAPAVLSAANEVAVAAFLEGRIRFTEIPRIIEETLAQHRGSAGEALELEAIEVADRWGREVAGRLSKG